MVITVITAIPPGHGVPNQVSCAREMITITWEDVISKAYTGVGPTPEVLMVTLEPEILEGHISGTTCLYTLVTSFQVAKQIRKLHPQCPGVGQGRSLILSVPKLSIIPSPAST